MPIKDVLLPLVGEASAAAIAAIEKCTAVAGDIGARVTAMAVEQDILVRPRVISADLDNTAAAEEARSVSNAQKLLQAFDAAANRIGVGNEQQLMALAATDIAASIAVRARLKDLSIVPIMPHDDQAEKIVEQLIFESGRPILMCPVEYAGELAVVITATDSKTPAELESGKALVSHLAEHAIKATFEMIKIDGSSVGKVFEAYIKANAIDLLVMGAYRHSRLNEMVWGGATKTVIGQPPCWVMMSR
jgi:nucleotide-binding universal stress UspA family protein